MTRSHRATVTIVSALALVTTLATSVLAQVGKGLIDPNVAAEGDLQALPHMTPAIVKSLLEKRPFMSVLDLNSFLLGQKLTPEQAAEFYRKAFVHINLNTGTREEILLIPGAGTRMARESVEYRPWKNWAVRQGNRQVRRTDGNGTVLAVLRDSVREQQTQSS